jgi:amino acid transporter
MSSNHESSDSSTDAPKRPEEPSVVRLTRKRDGDRPELALREKVQGSKPGSRFLRVPRRDEQKLIRVSDEEFAATPATLRATTPAGRLWASLRRVLIGPPLASDELPNERLSKLKGLAIFSSDNLSSSAYATEEILLVLLLAGTGALIYSAPVSLMIALLAVIVVTSYRQTIRAYPNGGGAYIVAKENLGLAPSLLAGSALFVDYVLTVAVSTAAGVAAITSAIPELHDYGVYLAIAFVGLLTVGNLRGIRESGTIFAVPTYFFIIVFTGMLVVGFARVLLGADLSAETPPNPIEPGAQTLTLFLFLRAFASGCAALTGVEAMANGVPYFKPPEARNASTTLVWMALILTSFFVGTTVLARLFDVAPSHSLTVVAQIAATIFGGSSPYFYAVQVATAMILILAANTSFAGLPAAASVMAQDRVMPKQFLFRGDRLAFSNGIIVVGVMSSVLLVAFQAETHALIPLYAFGVFTAFTLSQAGMIVHWRRVREAGWRRSLLINAVGAVATGLVAVIIGATKFVDGAWISMLMMAVLMLLMWRIATHYATVSEELRGEGPVIHQFLRATAAVPPIVIIPVDEINTAVLRTVAYALSVSPNTTAVHVAFAHEDAERIRQEWEQSVPDVPLIVVESPYRSLLQPLLAYIDAIERRRPDQTVTVVLPQFVTHRPWQALLHNRLGPRLKKALQTRPNTIVIDVPFKLAR